MTRVRAKTAQQKSTAQQLRDYRYRQWLSHLARLGIHTPKPFATTITASRLVRLHPRFMQRMRLSIGDFLMLQKEGGELRMVRTPSPLERRLERLRHRGALALPGGNKTLLQAARIS